jgi:ABC-2 type transport system permease protein
MNTFAALIKREILDGQNGFIRVPVIMAAVAVLLVIGGTVFSGATLEFGDAIIGESERNLAASLELAKENEKWQYELPAVVTFTYWVMGGLSWVAMPFVVFFSLLGALYEERRDRSILFWKSMPVPDWQEVLAKLITPILIAPLFFLVVAVAAQLVIAVILSIVVLAQGGSPLGLWPMGFMLWSWVSFIPDYLMWSLWALPLLAWVLFVSSYASRLPFLWAVLPIVLIAAAEGITFESTIFLDWVGTHIGGGMAEAQFGHITQEPETPREIYDIILGGSQIDMWIKSLMSGQFWLGLVIAAGLIFGTIEMRKRAV